MAIQRETETHYVDSLREHGYAAVPFGVNGTDIDQLFIDFRELSELAWSTGKAGQELVDAFRVHVPGHEETADYFMVQRRPGEVNTFNPQRSAGTDNKDMVHVGPRTMANAEKALGRRMPAVMRRFLTGCIELHEASKTSVRPVFHELDIEDIMLAPDPCRDIHVVRVLRYLDTAAAKTHKAELHFDRSATTLAVWESSPGLVGAPGNNAYGSDLSVERLTALADQANATPLQHVSGEAKFFLSAGYNHLPSEVRAHLGELPLLAHGVINDNPQAERDAVVVFMHPHQDYANYSVPQPSETGFNDLKKHLLAEQQTT